jgi:hypothetical protein
MVNIMLALGTLLSTTGCEAMESADNGSGKGWTKYTLLLEGVTTGATYSATVYNSEGASVGTAPGVKASGETVAITLKPGTKSPDPYFYPGGPYSVLLKGVRKEATKTNPITDTETRKISGFFFHEGDRSNTVEVNWEDNSEFVNRTAAGSTGLDANKAAVSLTVDDAYEYKLTVTIADNEPKVVSTGEVVPEWFDESEDSDGSKWSESWTFEPYYENDVIWTESYYPVYTGDLIFVMRNLITTIADKAAALQEALEEAETALEEAKEALDEAEYLKEALEEALQEGNAEKAAALQEALDAAAAALKDAEWTLQEALEKAKDAAAEAKVTAALQETMAAIDDVEAALQEALEEAEAAAKLLTAK